MPACPGYGQLVDKLAAILAGRSDVSDLYRGTVVGLGRADKDTDNAGGGG